MRLAQLSGICVASVVLEVSGWRCNEVLASSLRETASTRCALGVGTRVPARVPAAEGLPRAKRRTHLSSSSRSSGYINKFSTLSSTLLMPSTLYRYL